MIASAPTFPTRPAPDGRHLCVDISCSRCDAGSPFYVALANAAQAQGLAWNAAVSQGYRVEPATGRIACSGTCANALRRQEGDLPHWIDASKDPHDPRLRQPGPPAPPQAAKRSVKRTCSLCLAVCEFHQVRNAVDGEWSPDAGKAFAASGWVQRGGVDFCGLLCASKSAGGNSGQHPSDGIKQPVAVTKRILPSPARPALWAKNPLVSDDRSPPPARSR